MSETRVFERWYQDEYEFGDGYYAKGPVRVTEDWSTAEDDECEVRCLEGLDLRGGDDDEEYGDEVMGEITIGEIKFGRGDGDGGPLVRMG